jgi:hypothetical protein
MGINLSDTKYSFENKYDIMENSLQNSGLYKLKNRETRELYIGRELFCNDKN